ncbi:hypothetical protein PSI64_003004 [Escherichia coli]|nr:hypothetical protein [Escherichia coli]EKW3844635.1 hypothetical protein [Citrobacter amalonaticus]VAM32819.1 Uncharacterised protein [Enterobacter cloacae]HDK8911889.1 hypothetical protein [Escherichia coli]
MTMNSNGAGQKAGISKHSKSIAEHAKQIGKIIEDAGDRDLTDAEIDRINEFNDDIKKRSNEINRASKG